MMPGEAELKELRLLITVSTSRALQLHHQSLILLLQAQKSYNKEPQVKEIGK